MPEDGGGCPAADAGSDLRSGCHPRWGSTLWVQHPEWAGSKVRMLGEKARTPTAVFRAFCFPRAPQGERADPAEEPAPFISLQRGAAYGQATDEKCTWKG